MRIEQRLRALEAARRSTPAAVDTATGDSGGLPDDVWSRFKLLSLRCDEGYRRELLSERELVEFDACLLRILTFLKSRRDVGTNPRDAASRSDVT
jgi:hypothetical protein